MLRTRLQLPVAAAGRVLPRLTAIGFAALLTACAGTGGIVPESRLQDAAAVASAETLGGMTDNQAAWPTDAWWQRYQDPQLDRLVEEALRTSPSLRLAGARLRQAEALAGLAEAARAPQVSAGVKSMRQEFSSNSTVPKPLAGSWNWINDASVNFNYELDFWGKNASAFDAALGRAKAAEADTHAARLLLTVSIVQGYLKLDQLHLQLELAQTTLEQRLAILKLTQQRVAAQIDSLAELRQAELAVPTARGEIAALQETIALARSQLAALMGEGPDRGLRIARPALHLPDAFRVPASLSSDLVARRPDIVALRWRVEAFRHDIDAAHAQFYPSINLVGLIGLQSLGFDKLLGASSQVVSAGPALSLPLFDGGRLRSNLRARAADYDVAVEQYNQGVLDAVRDVVAQLTSLHWLGERAHEQDLALHTAEEAYQLTLQRYRAGLGTYLQVLAAETQVLAQRRAGVDLTARALDLDLNLTRALGGGYHDTHPI